jgi:hypothetical protein
MAAALGILALAGCGGGSGSSGSGSSPTYAVGGSISALSASGLVLTTGSQTVSPAANATSFTFPTALASGASYDVTVTTQPAGLTCAVTNGSGTIASAAITNVAVTCATNNLSGTAATGSAIAGATVTLVDSQGSQVTATTDSSGKYSLSTSGLTAPFLVKVVTAASSKNGYAAGTTFYSVSDQATPSVINVTPLTDLIIRDWYASQSSPVAVSTAFSAPAANPPPTVADVQVVETVVLDIVQPVLQQNGVNPVGLDLISGSFSADGQGVDGALDAIQPITYNAGGTAATVTIATTSSTTQTTTVTASSGSIQVSTTTSNSSSGATSSVVTTSVLPTSSAAAAALAGVQTTLNGIASVVNSDGSALSAQDLSPYIASGFLNGGTTADQESQQIANTLAGATINSIAVTRITKYDSTNNTIGIVGAIAYTENGASGVIQLDGGDGNGAGLIFKQQANGSWLLNGDQQQAKAQAQIISLLNNEPGSGPSSQIELFMQVSVPASSANTPCASTYATSVSAVPATAITATDSGSGTTVTIGTGGYALTEDPAVYTENGVARCQFDGDLSGNLVLPAGSLPALVGNSIGFGLDGAAPVGALTRSIAGYTTETVNFTNLTSHALSAANLGQPLTLNWTLPVTFPINSVQVYGSVEVASGSNYVSCTIEASGTLSVTTTSTTLTLPTTCNGSSVVTIPQTGSQPYPVQLNVVIQGTHGEVAQAWWPFN